MMHRYEVRPRKDKRGFDLISEQLPFGSLWYRDVDAAVGYAEFYSRAHETEVRIVNEANELVGCKRWDRRMPNEGL
jgi:hypothetical protein